MPCPSSVSTSPRRHRTHLGLRRAFMTGWGPKILMVCCPKQENTPRGYPRAPSPASSPHHVREQDPIPPPRRRPGQSVSQTRPGRGPFPPPHQAHQLDRGRGDLRGQPRAQYQPVRLEDHGQGRSHHAARQRGPGRAVLRPRGAKVDGRVHRGLYGLCGVRSSALAKDALPSYCHRHSSRPKASSAIANGKM